MKSFRHPVRTVVLSGLFIAMGVLTPRIFHLFGAVAGQTFLPMHIPVLIAGLSTSAICAGICGAFSPMLSCLITGMPSPVKMPFMCIELFTYGITSALSMSFFEKRIKNHTLRVYICLIISQAFGRAANILCTLLAVKLLGITNPAISISAAVASIPAGIIGIIIQLIFIPPVVMALERYVTIG